MFTHMATNTKAEAIKSWLANNKSKETQETLANKFGKSRTFVSLALNKKMVTQGAETLVNDMYEFLDERYGI